MSFSGSAQNIFRVQYDRNLVWHNETQNRNLVALAATLADDFRAHPSGAREFPSRELVALSEAGLLGVALPTELGGTGLGLEPSLRGGLLPLLKEIGRGNLPLGRVFEGHVNALLLIGRFGTREQLLTVAEDVLVNRHVLGVWNTGPPKSPLLTESEEGYRLAGSKTFATGAGRIQQAIVTAALPDGGWQMCLTPLSEVVIHRETWEPLGMEATDSFAVEFGGLELAPGALIGKPGDYYAEPTFTSGALRFSAVQLGAAQALFDATIQFLKGQGRANDPFQLQRLGELAVLMESADQWLTRASDWLEVSFTNADSIAGQSQMTRVAAEEICTRVIQLVEVSVGARGLTTPEPFARTIRDLQMYLRQGGFDHALQVAGRQALGE